MTELDNRCPDCSWPADVWADNSDGITVNFRCLNFDCKSGKGPWDTPPPPLPGQVIPLPRIEAHATLRHLRRMSANLDMRIGLAKKAGDLATVHKLKRMRGTLKRARKAFLQREGIK